MPHLQEPVLTFAVDNVSKMKSIDDQDISAMWTVFTKCKDGLENGRRLENMSWRLWYRSVHSGYSYSNGSDLSKSIATAADAAHVAALKGNMVHCPVGWRSVDNRLAQKPRKEEPIHIDQIQIPQTPAVAPTVQSPTSVSPSSVSKILTAVETSSLPPSSPNQKSIVPTPPKPSSILKRTTRTFAMSSLNKRPDQPTTTILASPAAPEVRPKVKFFVSDSDSTDSDVEPPSPTNTTEMHTYLFAPEPIQPIPQQQPRAYQLPCFDDNTEDDDDYAEYPHHRRGRTHDQGFDADSDDSDSEMEYSDSYGSTFDEGLCFTTPTTPRFNPPPMFNKIAPHNNTNTHPHPPRSSALSAQIRSRPVHRDNGLTVDPRRKEWTESVRSAVVWERRMPFGTRTDRSSARDQHHNTATGSDHLYW